MNTLTQYWRSIALPYQQAIHNGIQYSTAFLLAFACMPYLPGGKSQWVMVTIAVILGAQTLMGLRVQKALLRLEGTLIGAGLGLLVLFLPDHVWLIILSLIIVCFFFSFFSSKEGNSSYPATLGMATFSIIAFAPTHSVLLAGYRTIDIGIGIVISLLVSRFIFPLTSLRAMTQSAQALLNHIHSFGYKIFVEGIERRNNILLTRIDSNISKQILKQRSVIAGASFESTKAHRKKDTMLTVLRFLRATYHYFLFIDTALWESRRSTLSGYELMQPHIKSLMSQILVVMNGLLDETSHDSAKKSLEKLSSSLCDERLHFDSSILHQEDISRYFAIEFVITRIEVCLFQALNAWWQLHDGVELTQD